MPVRKTTMKNPILINLIPPQEQKDWAPGPEAYKNQVEQIESDFGSQSPEYACALIHLGSASLAQGRSHAPLARQFYEQALAIHLAALGEDSIQTAWNYDLLAAVNNSAGDRASARDYLARAIAIWERLAERNVGEIDQYYLERRREDMRYLEITASRDSRSIAHAPKRRRPPSRSGPWNRT